MAGGRTRLAIRTVEDAANVVAGGAVVAVELVEAVQINLQERDKIRIMAIQ